MILTFIAGACAVLFAVAIVVAVLWYRHLIAEGAEVERRDDEARRRAAETSPS